MQNLAQRTQNHCADMTLSALLANERLQQTRVETKLLAQGMLEGARRAGVRICDWNDLDDHTEAFLTVEGDIPEESGQYRTVTPAFIVQDTVVEKGILMPLDAN